MSLRIESSQNPSPRQLGLHDHLERNGDMDIRHRIAQDRVILRNRHLYSLEDYEAACDRLAQIGIPVPRIIREPLESGGGGEA